MDITAKLSIEQSDAVWTDYVNSEHSAGSGYFTIHLQQRFKGIESYTWHSSGDGKHNDILVLYFESNEYKTWFLLNS
jgi:hypothetical protein